MADDYEFTFLGDLVITPEDGDVDEATVFEAVFDDAMSELCKLADAIDPSVSGTLSTGTIEVRLTVEAESLTDATGKAETLVRTALHSAEVSTKNWPANGAVFVDFRKVTIEDAVDDAVCV